MSENLTERIEKTKRILEDPDSQRELLDTLINQLAIMEELNTKSDYTEQCYACGIFFHQNTSALHREHCASAWHNWSGK